LELLFRINRIDFGFLYANGTHSIHFPRNNPRDHFLQITREHVAIDVNDSVCFLGPGMTQAAESNNQYQDGFESGQGCGFLL
jgi:hypothetical protein